MVEGKLIDPIIHAISAASWSPVLKKGTKIKKNEKSQYLQPTQGVNQLLEVNSQTLKISLLNHFYPILSDLIWKST